MRWPWKIHVVAKAAKAFVGQRAETLGAFRYAGASNPRRDGKPRRGFVIVVVMVTMLFATAALLTFMEKASNDLLVEQRAATANRLRAEAYSALEVTLAVLEEFRG